MGSGRHGAARPPIGVLIQQDRVDFSLFASIIVIALAVMVLIGFGLASAAFWLAFLPIIVASALIVRRIGRLSRDELRDEELL
jgi:1,4-dihydroxy-2-naphthoate octaprenyltransferase